MRKKRKEQKQRTFSGVPENTAESTSDDGLVLNAARVLKEGKKIFSPLNCSGVNKKKKKEKKESNI